MRLHHEHRHVVVSSRVTEKVLSTSPLHRMSVRRGHRFSRECVHISQGRHRGQTVDESSHREVYAQYPLVVRLFREGRRLSHGVEKREKNMNCAVQSKL